MWQLGGKGGSFTMGPGVQFEWQHDARLQPDGTLTLFDNASSPEEESQSERCISPLDIEARRRRSLSSYTHTPRLLAGSQGNVQMLPNGNMFVGWGDRRPSRSSPPSGADDLRRELPGARPDLPRLSLPLGGAADTSRPRFR